VIHVGLIFKEPIAGFGEGSAEFALVISIIREPNAQCHVLIDRRHTQRRVPHLLAETVSQSASQILIGKSDHRFVNADRFVGCVAHAEGEWGEHHIGYRKEMQEIPSWQRWQDLDSLNSVREDTRRRFIKASTHSGVEPRIATRSPATSFQETPCSHIAFSR
jgi:hypothetical protein